MDEIDTGVVCIAEEEQSDDRTPAVCSAGGIERVFSQLVCHTIENSCAQYTVHDGLKPAEEESLVACAAGSNRRGDVSFGSTAERRAV